MKYLTTWLQPWMFFVAFSSCATPIDRAREEYARILKQEADIRAGFLGFDRMCQRRLTRPGLTRESAAVSLANYRKAQQQFIERRSSVEDQLRVAGSQLLSEAPPQDVLIPEIVGKLREQIAGLKTLASEVQNACR